MSELDLTAKNFSLANARELALYARMAYDEPPTIHDERTDTNILIRDLGNCIIVASKGTSDLRNFITDARAWRTHTLLGGIHTGFYEAAMGIWEKLQAALQPLRFLPSGGIYQPLRFKPIIVTGHSLGGALAIILAKLLRDAFFNVHSVYTFGCPRPGDKVFRDNYNPTYVPGSPFENLGAATFTVINNLDVIARLPGYLSGYRREGHDEFISANGLLTEDPSFLFRVISDVQALALAGLANKNPECLAQLIADHHINKYIAALEAVRGEDCPPDSCCSDQEAAP